MNEPIINPWIFYFADVSMGIKLIAIIFFVISFILTFGLLLEKMDSIKNEYKMNEQDRKVIKPAVTILCISSILAIFMPFSETVYKMAITQQITPANIQAVEETGKDFVDYIIEKVKETHNE